MSQRLIQPGLAGMRHPHTGRPVSPIGYRRNGAPIWPVMGASEDDDTGGTGDDDSGGDDDSDESDDEDDDEDDDKDKKKKKGKDEDDEEEVVSKRKYDKLHQRMQAADRRSSDLQRQLDELKASADLPAELKKEINDIKAQVAEKDRQIATLTKAHDTSVIKYAALTVKNAPAFENIDAALRLTDLTDVEVFEDGKVDTVALRKALKKTATDHPYMVKAKKNASDAGSTNDQGSGSTMNGRRKGQPQTPDRAALASRFPVLGQR